MAQPSAEHLQFRFGVATPACRTIRTLLEISQAGGFLFALMFQTITLMDGMFNADAGHPGRVRGLETTRNESCMAFRSDIAGERFPVRVDVPDHNAHGWHV